MSEEQNLGFNTSEDQQFQENDVNMESNGAAMDNGGAGENGNHANQSKEDEDERKLFIGGLAHGTTEETIKQYFSSYGEIAKIDLKYDLETKKSRGFGFVTFATSAALNAVLADGSHTINGKTIDPKKAMARPKPPPMKKVFVGGVSGDIAEEEIRQHFCRYGPIEKMEMPVDKETSKRRAFCFVVFETEDGAKAAVKQNKQTIGNMTKECDIKLATPPAPKDGPGMGRFGGFGGRGFNHGSVGGGRGRGRGGFQNNAGGGGYGGNSGGYGGGYNQGYQGYGNGGGGAGGGSGAYDYNYSGGYGGGYGNQGYDNNYWNYGQGGSGGSGYNQQGSGYGKVKRGGSQGAYQPY